MKFWILLGIVLLLLLWGLREKFEATPSIRGPPYDAEEKRRIFNMALQKERRPPYTFLGYQDRLIERAKQQNAGENDRKKLEEIAGGFLTPAIQEFFTTKFKPATTPLTKEDVKAFMVSYTGVDKDITEQVLNTYFIEQAGTTRDTEYQKELTKLGQGAGYLVPNRTGGAPSGGGVPPATSSSEGAMPGLPPGGSSEQDDTVDPICPRPSTLTNRGKCAMSDVTNFTCPSGYVATSSRNCEKIGDSSMTMPPQCPSGKIFDNNAGGCVSSPPDATCPSGYAIVNEGYRDRCKRTGSSSVTTASPPGSAMTSSGGTPTPGNTTGGSSTTAFGPTSGGSAGTRFKVWGPVGGGREESADGVQPMDTSKSNKYPELLGGLGSGGEKTRIDGVGLTEPSSSWQLGISGMLPDAKSLGTTDLSKYLPFSRTPGDMEKIPDPYRVSQTFRTSSYSSKTEPVPFLADFSAFQK